MSETVYELKAEGGRVRWVCHHATGDIEQCPVGFKLALDPAALPPGTKVTLTTPSDAQSPSDARSLLTRMLRAQFAPKKVPG